MEYTFTQKNCCRVCSKTEPEVSLFELVNNAGRLMWFCPRHKPELCDSLKHRGKNFIAYTKRLLPSRNVTGGGRRVFLPMCYECAEEFDKNKRRFEAQYR